jgi:hypothetical protein
MVVMIRARADPESLIPTVRRRVASLDRNLPIQSLRVFEKTLGAELERRRFSTVLLRSFFTLAMILAARRHLRSSERLGQRARRRDSDSSGARRPNQ